MAIYLYDQYGRSKYGPRLQYEFGVYPFAAETLDYTTVQVTWNEPDGDWDQFLLIRSRSGYVTSPLDGFILYDIADGPTTGQAVDNNLSGGWYYYTILLHNPDSETWEQAGSTSVLVPFDYDSTERLWSFVPEYYRLIRDDTTAGYSDVLYNINPQVYLSNKDTVDNDVLFRFLTVLGWGLDILRTQIDTILDGYDPNLMHISRLSLLAHQFGGVLESSVPTKNNRSLVRNLPLLYRKRGTPDGIRDTLTLTTGVEVEMYRGPNMMLNRDQALYTPVNVPFWDRGTRYVFGDIVMYNGLPRAVVTGQTPFGPAQAPPSGSGSNTWWNTATSSTLFTYPHPGSSWTATQAAVHVPLMSTNMTVSMAYAPVSVFTDLGLGTLGWTQNAADHATHDILVTSVDPATVSGFDRQNVTQWGVPIPAVKKWAAGTYFRGDRALYKGVTYEALKQTTDAPNTSSWTAVGYDERVRVGFSFYAHGPDSGTAGTGGIPVVPYLLLFDEEGGTVFQGVPPTPAATDTFDSFNQPGNVVSGRAPDFGPAWGSAMASVGTWDQTRDDLGGYTYPTITGRTFQTITGTANGNLGVTIRRVRTGEIGLMFRATNASNFWMALNTGLYKVVSNVRSTVVNWTDLSDGDRMVVTMNNNAIGVKVNGVSVGTATDSFNASATLHGIISET